MSSSSLQWATLDEILDKLLFVSVSGDGMLDQFSLGCTDVTPLVIVDPVFIQHFFLTYRRFATPRSVLLGMQKRMIELGKETRDPLLAKFAQMRLVFPLSPCNSIDYCFGRGGLRPLITQLLTSSK